MCQTCGLTAFQNRLYFDVFFPRNFYDEFLEKILHHWQFTWFFFVFNTGCHALNARFIIACRINESISAIFLELIHNNVHIIQIALDFPRVPHCLIGTSSIIHFFSNPRLTILCGFFCGLFHTYRKHLAQPTINKLAEFDMGSVNCKAFSSTKTVQDEEGKENYFFLFYQPKTEFPFDYLRKSLWVTFCWSGEKRRNFYIFNVGIP